MQFQNNFDLEEFLAYLLPGFLFWLGVAISYPDALASTFVPLKDRTSELLAGFILSVSFIAASLLAGHVFSFVSRRVWQPFVNIFGADPERVIFTHLRGRSSAALRAFFSPSILLLIKARFQQIYGVDYDTDEVAPATPRMIRAAVAREGSAVTATRQQVVRARALCSNMVTPVLILPWLLPLAAPSWVTITIGILIAAMLLLKQRELDVREVKETYLAFIAIAK